MDSRFFASKYKNFFVEVYMSEEENNEVSKIKVTDRRISYDEEDTEEEKTDAKDEIKTDEPEKKKSLKEKLFGNKKPEDTVEGQTDEAPGNIPAPEINFAAFVLSLSGSAMFNIGAIPNPETGKTEKNLPLAKQTIDILEMLKEKTKGNLEPDEEKLIEDILYDLRMQYVNAAK